MRIDTYLRTNAKLLEAGCFVGLEFLPRKQRNHGVRSVSLAMIVSVLFGNRVSFLLSFFFFSSFFSSFSARGDNVRNGNDFFVTLRVRLRVSHTRVKPNQRSLLQLFLSTSCCRWQAKHWISFLRKCVYINVTLFEVRISRPREFQNI